jgi:hypothetical protein
VPWRSAWWRRRKAPKTTGRATNAPIQESLQHLARIRVIARGLQEVGTALRLPATIPVEAIALVFRVPVDALRGILDELVAHGAGAVDAGVWTIATSAHVDALIAALVAHAG